MKNELPQNWVIDTQKEKDSPLMPKFLDWFEENRTENRSIRRYCGFYEQRLRAWHDLDNQIIITLEQWNAFYFPEWQPKQGEMVLARKNGDGWFKRTFAVYHNGFYFCEKLHCKDELLGFKEVKQLPKESTLQPIMDQLKAEAEKLGLKVNITVEWKLTYTKK